MAFLPAPQTFGSQFGAGLGKGIAETLPEKLEQFITTKRSEREKSSINQKIEKLGENATLTDKMGVWLSSNLSPEDKKQGYEMLKQEGATGFAEKFKNQNYTVSDIVEGTSLGYITPGLAPILAAPLLKDPLEQKVLQQLLGTNGDLGLQAPVQEEQITETISEEAPISTGQIPTGDVPIQAPPMSTAKNPTQSMSADTPMPTKAPRVTKSGKGGWSQVPDEDLSKFALLKGPVADSAKLELNRREKEKEREFKERELEFKGEESAQKRKEFGHTSTAQYAADVRESAKNSEEVQHAVGEVKRIAESGETGVNAKNLFQEFLKNRSSFLANAFINKTQQNLISATKSLAGGFRELFGARPTQREFFWYENILPNILKDADTNIAAADYFGRVANNRVRTQEVMDDIVEENGGFRPIDLDVKVRKRMKPEQDRLITEGERLYKEQQAREAMPKQDTAQTTEADFDMKKMPPASGHEGKTIEDDKGNKYKSNGKNWRKL